MDDKEIEIEVSSPAVGVEIMAPPGMEEMTNQLQGMFQNLGGNRSTTRKLKVKEALKQLTDEEAAECVRKLLAYLGDDPSRNRLANPRLLVCCDPVPARRDEAFFLETFTLDGRAPRKGEVWKNEALAIAP